jgi:hypothetical protein
MPNIPTILANAGDDFGKIIFGVIVFVIWGIGALVKMSKTQTAQSRKRQEELNAAIREQLEVARQREAAAAALGQPPPLRRQQQQPQRRQARPPLPPQMRQPPVAMRSPAPPRTPQQFGKQQKRRAVSPGQPAAAIPQALLEEIPQVATSEIGRGSVPASPARRQAATGPAIRLTAANLRQQFILTEILQPPLALREQSTL